MHKAQSQAKQVMGWIYVDLRESEPHESSTMQVQGNDNDWFFSDVWSLQCTSSWWGCRITLRTMADLLVCVNAGDYGI